MVKRKVDWTPTMVVGPLTPDLTAGDRPNFEGHRSRKFARHIGCELSTGRARHRAGGQDDETAYRWCG